MGKIKEECGVFGIFNNSDAATLTALGLHSLQHRGQEGCGIVSFDGKNFHSERRLGLVGDNFTKGKVLNKPVYELLGGKKQDFVIPYASLQPVGHSFQEYKDSLVAWAEKAKSLGVKEI